MSTLYRKYRPKSFSEVVGQPHVITTITNALARAQTAHAYLLTGPRGIGKTTIARLLSKAVNCLSLQPGAEPCNACTACVSINNGQALDVMEIDAASHTGVDNVREQILEYARFHPSQLKMKVFIIDEVHMLSTAAFNALLKILEEPPAHVLFVLATTELHKIPATIVSRCQRFDLHKMATPVIVGVLEKNIKEENIAVPSEVLYRVARSAGGCLRDAQSILGQLLALGGQQVTAEQADLLLPPSQINTIVLWLGHLLDKNIQAALECLKQLAESGANLEVFTKEATEVLRQILLGKVDAVLATDLFNDPVVGELAQKISKQADLLVLEQWLEKLLETKEWFRQTDIPLLPLELFSVQAINLLVKEEKPKIKTIDKTDKHDPPALPKTDQEPEIEAAPAASSKPVLVTANSSLKEAWPQIIQEVRKRNTSLGGCLKLAEVLEITEEKVSLGFRYKFYLDRVSDRKNREIFVAVTQELIGKKVSLETVLIKSEHTEAIVQSPVVPVPGDGFLQNVLSTFGGEVVE